MTSHTFTPQWLRIMRNSILLGCAALFVMTEWSFGGDPTVTRLVAPQGPVKTGLEYQLQAEVKNLSDYSPTRNVSVAFEVYHPIDHKLILSSTVNLDSIDIGASEIVTCGTLWFIDHPGLYDIVITISADEDTDSTNNESTNTVEGKVIRKESKEEYPNSGRGGDPVSTFTGEYFFTESSDLELDGPMTLRFQRYYASGMQDHTLEMGAMGMNWIHNYDMELLRFEGEIHVLMWKGRHLRFVGSDRDWQLDWPRALPYYLSRDGTAYFLGDPRSHYIYVFDTTGVLQQIRDGRGNAHILEYTRGNLTNITDGVGRTMTLGYDPSGKLTSVTDGGRTVRFTYSGDLLTAVTDVRGNTTAYKYYPPQPIPGLMEMQTLPEGNSPYRQGYDARGRVFEQHDAYGNRTRFSFPDTLGGTTVCTNPLNRTTKFEHTNTGLLIRYTDELGRSTVYRYNDYDQLIRITDRQNRITEYTHHRGSGRVDTVTDAKGQRTIRYFNLRSILKLPFFDLTRELRADSTMQNYEYDSSGRLTRYLDPTLSQWRISVNDRGLPTSIVTPEGAQNGYTYDRYYMQSSYTDLSGNSEVYTYDGYSRLIRIKYPDGGVKELEYDERGNVVNIKEQGGDEFIMTYDRNGRLVRITDTDASSAEFVYDQMNRIVGYRDFEGNNTNFEYNANGKMVRKMDPLGQVSLYEYDPRGVVTKRRLASQSEWQYTYDDDMVLNGFVDPEGQMWSFSSDELGRIVSIDWPGGHRDLIQYNKAGKMIIFDRGRGWIFRMRYDENGRLVFVSLPGDTIATHYQRNAYGQVVTILDPMQRRWLREYNQQGLLTANVDPLGKLHQYSYNNKNLPDEIRMPVGTVQIDYNAEDKVVRMEYTDGSIRHFSYDTTGRLQGSNDLSLSYDAMGNVLMNNSLVMEYDDNNRISRMHFGPGKTVEYFYVGCNCGLVSQIRDHYGRVIENEYNASGQIIRTMYPNGIATQYAYDSDGRLERIAHDTLLVITLKRNLLGMIEKIECTPSGDAPMRGAATRLSYDAACQMNSYPHDPAGRMEQDNRVRYIWNDASQVVRIEESGKICDIEYDGTGLPVRKSGNALWSSITWNYATRIPTPAVVKQDSLRCSYNVFDPCGNLLSSIDSATGRALYYHFDQSGNVILVTDDSAQVVAQYAYTPYGVKTTRVDKVDGIFCWLGRYGIIEDGPSRYIIRKRWYNAELARFVSRDLESTFGPRDVNPYQYAFDNPLHYHDILGEQSEKQPQAEGRGEKASSGPPPRATRFANLTRDTGPDLREALDEILKEDPDFLTCRPIDPSVKNAEATSEYAAALRDIENKRQRVKADNKCLDRLWDELLRLHLDEKQRDIYLRGIQEEANKGLSQELHHQQRMTEMKKYEAEAKAAIENEKREQARIAKHSGEEKEPCSVCGESKYPSESPCPHCGME